MDWKNDLQPQVKAEKRALEITYAAPEIQSSSISEIEWADS